MAKLNIKLKILAFLLAKLGIPLDIESLDKRKRIQKAVYIAQRIGFDMGYRFEWYPMGPYCESLTQDYYSIAESIKQGDDSYKGIIPKEELEQKIHKIKLLISTPENIRLTPENWLELIASLDYLVKVSKYNSLENAEKEIRKLKPYLSDDRAYELAKDLLKQIFKYK